MLSSQSKKKIKFYLFSSHKKDIFSCIEYIKKFAKTSNLMLSGPIPFKLKKLVVPCRKSVDGEGSETWDHWQLKVYKFLFLFDQNKYFFEKLISLKIPPTVTLKLIIA